MNYAMTIYQLGQVLRFEGYFLLLSALVAWINSESCGLSVFPMFLLFSPSVYRRKRNHEQKDD